MAYGIAEIRTEVARILTNTTPDVESGITFKELPYTGGLDDLEVCAKPSDTTRGFHANAIPNGAREPGVDNPVFLARIDIDIRYQAHRDRTGLQRVGVLAAADTDRLAKAIIWPDTGHWTGVTLEHVKSADLVDSVFTPSPTREGLWILTLTFLVAYWLGD